MGLFVFLGIALLVGAVILLGGGTVFEKTIMMETSFYHMNIPGNT